MIKVDMLSLDLFVACFWQAEGEQWEGVVNKELYDSEVKLIRADKAIILLQKGDLVQPVAASNENNHLPR